MYRYPGLFGDPRSGRLWPAALFSVLFHIALLWGFSRFHIQSLDRIFHAPIQMVELVPPGSERAARAAAPKTPQASIFEPEEPPPEEAAPKPVSTAKPNPPDIPIVPPKPEPPPLKPGPDPAVGGPQVEVAAKPPQPSAWTPTPRPDPRLTGKPAFDADALKQKLAQQRGEIERRDRIETAAKSRPPAPLGGRDDGLGAIRDRIRADGKAGPGVRGGSGAGLQAVAENNYYDLVRTYIRSKWSTPPAFVGRGYKTVVAITLNRDGRLTNERGETSKKLDEPIVPHVEKSSGNRQFDELAQRAVMKAIMDAEPKKRGERGLLAFPPLLQADYLDLGLNVYGDEE